MDQLRYTKDNGRLTPSQRNFYEKNGYLMIPDLVSQASIDKYRKRFYDLIEGRASTNEITVMRDVVDKKTVNKVQDIHFDAVFSEYIKNEKILDVVECFTGPNILAIHTMLIAKPPDSGFGTSKHPPHQDLYYFPFRPADRIVAAWTAMETCDKENGCLYVAPGSHIFGRMWPHEYPPGVSNKFYHGIQKLSNTMHFVELEMKSGDTVFFHPLLIHGSDINKSNRTRLAISCHYAAVECNYEMDPLQQPIEEEILKYTQKKFPGIQFQYKDLWEMKSMLVRGIQSSL